MESQSTAARSIIGLAVNSGVSGLNLSTYYLACFTSIMLATFLPQSQAFLLAEQLRIPESEQGVISGDLNFWGELAIISTVGLFGALSDRVGRRLVIAIGFAIMGLGLYLYPRATEVNDLLLYRIIYSVGISAVICMIVTVVADYVRDRSRGKASGYLGVMNGLGAMVAALVLIRLPARFIEGGMSVVDAGLATYGIVAAIALLSAVAMFFGLRKDREAERESGPGLLRIFGDGLSAARDPGIALAYGAAFVARGNLAVAGTFLALWLTTYGTSELALSAADALARGATIIAISYTAALFGAPLFGVMTDRMRRTTALSVTLLIAVVGYGGTIFVSNPFGGAMIALAVVIGLSEVGCVITSGVLVAQQAPEKIRGSVIGVFNLSGAVGILVASKAGGYLFDYWRPAGPFVLFALVALAVLVWSLSIRFAVASDAEEQSTTQVS